MDGGVVSDLHPGQCDREEERWPQGIVKRHSTVSLARRQGRRCKAGDQASVSPRRDGKKIGQTFAREGEASTGAPMPGLEGLVGELMMVDRLARWHAGAKAAPSRTDPAILFKSSASAL